MRSDSEKLYFFTLETSKNHLIRSFLRNGRLRVNPAASRPGQSVHFSLRTSIMSLKEEIEKNRSYINKSFYKSVLKLSDIKGKD